jgi:hypothetical protein
VQTFVASEESHPTFRRPADNRAAEAASGGHRQAPLPARRLIRWDFAGWSPWTQSGPSNRRSFRALIRSSTSPSCWRLRGANDVGRRHRRRSDHRRRHGSGGLQFGPQHRNGPRATLRAFDRIELDGEDLRWQPIEDRKSRLQKPIDNQHTGIAFNKLSMSKGAFVFHHACKLGCQGIVSKRLGSPYRSGRVDHWLKIKNPRAPAVRREAEEDWNGKRMTSGGRSRPGIPTAGW